MKGGKEAARYCFPGRVHGPAQRECKVFPSGVVGSKAIRETRDTEVLKVLVGGWVLPVSYGVASEPVLG